MVASCDEPTGRRDAIPNPKHHAGLRVRGMRELLRWSYGSDFVRCSLLSTSNSYPLPAGHSA